MVVAKEAVVPVEVIVVREPVVVVEEAAVVVKEAAVLVAAIVVVTMTTMRTMKYDEDSSPSSQPGPSRRCLSYNTMSTTTCKSDPEQRRDAAATGPNPAESTPDSGGSTYRGDHDHQYDHHYL